MIVVDASTIVAALVDDGADGRWAESILASGPLAAPHSMPVEVANVLRRLVLSGEITREETSLAHADLLALRVDLYPYAPFASRVWQLLANVTAYDAWYVALAEALDVRLATLDVRLSKAPGIRCDVELPRHR